MTDQPPDYLRIAADLWGRISSGQLQPGDRLPTEKQLQQDNGVSSTVAKQALLLLNAQGVITRRRGSGTYVAERARQVRALTPHQAELGDAVPAAVTHIRDELTPRVGTPSEIDLLGLSPSGTWWVMECKRTYFAGDTPMKTEDVVVPAGEVSFVVDVPLADRRVE